MRIILHIETNLPRKVFLQLAARGLTSTNDAGEAVVVALEESVAGDAATIESDRVAAILRLNNGNVKRTADELGIARSTVRARAKKANG